MFTIATPQSELFTTSTIIGTLKPRTKLARNRNYYQLISYDNPKLIEINYIKFNNICANGKVLQK